MPLPIKTAVDNGDRTRTVCAMLVTMSFASSDVENLVGQPVDPVIQIDHAADPSDYPPARIMLTFYYVPPGRPPVRHVAQVAVPGYLLWDGDRIEAVTPRVFAQQYTVLSRYTPAPRPSRHFG